MYIYIYKCIMDIIPMIGGTYLELKLLKNPFYKLSIQTITALGK